MDKEYKGWSLFDKVLIIAKKERPRFLSWAFIVMLFLLVVKNLATAVFYF